MFELLQTVVINYYHKHNNIKKQTIKITMKEHV